jgi:hypothetical protein
MPQRLLFSGLDCLPGQRDLFPTDGEPEREENAASAQSASKKPSPKQRNPHEPLRQVPPPPLG